MYTKQEQAEAIRAIARNYDISEELSYGGYSFLQALDLVNVRKSDITCLGKCKNGGACQQLIAREYVIKGVLRMIQVVFDSSIQGEDLETRLEMTFMYLLCTQNHSDYDQAAGCMDERIEAVEEFRIAHGIGSSQQDSQSSCAATVQEPEPSIKEFSSPLDWKATYEALDAKNKSLEKEKDSSQQEVVCLQKDIKNLLNENAGMEDDKKRVQENLTKVKEDKAALEIENCVLQIENDEMKTKTEAVRVSLGSLKLQLDGEVSDGEGYGTPRKPADMRPARDSPSITTKSPFDFTFQSGQNLATKRPSTTPRDSTASSFWLPKSGVNELAGGIDALSLGGGFQPRSFSSNLNSSAKPMSRKDEKGPRETKRRMASECDQGQQVPVALLITRRVTHIRSGKGYELRMLGFSGY